MSREFTAEQALATTEGEPVEGFPIVYQWHTGPWQEIFDRQVALIRSDVRRARAENKLIVYLSVPISARGGGYSGTNVDIAKYTERRLLQEWGEGFWILNPAQYQLESKAGTGLIEQHAKDLDIDLTALQHISNPPLAPVTPRGGDYMRMWTKVLVENDGAFGFESGDPALANTGQHFDAFYFLGPRDVRSFFAMGAGGASLTAGIQSYFARRFANDPDFRDAFSVPGLVFGAPAAPGVSQAALRTAWELRRIDFFRYYGLKASANFSLGSHDEWAIFRALNALRRKKSSGPGQVDGDASLQLAGFFDGGQIDPASSEAGLSKGYAL